MTEAGTMEFTGRRAELKKEFIEKRGYWAEFWDHLLTLEPNFFEAYLGYSALPWSPGVLEPKLKEFVYIVIDIATTHLYELGTRIHYQNAIKYGATPREIMEVIKVTSDLGLHTMTLGVPALVRALERRGQALPPETDEMQSLKESFVETHGYWDDAWACIARMDPAYFAAALSLSGSAHKSAVLDEKTIALMRIAASASTTHLHAPTVETQIERALDHGATAAEIMEVLQLASVLGLHSCTFGVPILVEELAKLGQSIAVDPS
jgi:alkylhydroperoxidase/carboxymuconolactone decarboxylase family protein YurZ